MKYTTLALLCCGALISACDNSDDTNKLKESGTLEQVSTLASEEAAKMKNEIDSAVEAANDSAESMAESAETTAAEALAAGKELEQAAVDSASAAIDSGKKMTTTVAAKAGAAISSASSEETAKGEDVYTKKCSACHGSGVAGSPKLGDKAAWKSRISQGEAIMTKHAIEGFKGDTGYMPAKGGFTSLSDEEVAAAVKYMAAKAQ